MIDLEKKGKKATGLKKPGDWIYKPDKDFWIVVVNTIISKIVLDVFI